ncbi:hypothetical protein A5684_21340 [Mycobacterium intracellulare]|uniref:putative alpha/beta hydrolase n=1 Tax=Mycobacterium intracellulare TaxID=1767 RepID=UPI0007EB6D52|nr:hypothetical protein [Mycobacterium intracellulare]OBH71345.1 hypothetical protein A5684_21340 [Mycobacterium intracellulare]
MGLPYIDEQALIAAAGGDPWAINASLQAGSPLQISNLAGAFHRAGRCTAEAENAFQQARARFEAAWNHHDGGDHPINDSDEVQRVTKSLGAQSLQLPKIAADLEGIAASLADAQKAGAARIATLEAQLKNVSDMVSQAVSILQNDKSLSAGEKDALHALINTCEDDALRDTKAALAALQSIRNGYADGLQKSLNSLHAEGYDGAPLHGADADGLAPPSPAQQAALAAIRQATNQAVVDQMAKVRAAQEALSKAAADLYTHGPGSPEGEAASAKLPKLKADLARALDDLGKIPDYNGVDPASINVGPDGHFTFTYNVNGQPVQAYGQLKNGTGEFFDQATGTYYTFNGGKLTGMRTPDPGQVEATAEPLFTAVTLATGAPALKAGGEAAFQGLKMLFSREMLEGVTADNVFPRALAGAEERFQAAEQNLASHTPLPGEPVPGTHPLEPPPVEHAPPAAHGDIPAEHAPAGPHVGALPDSPAPVVIDPAHPEFHLDNSLNYMPPELRALSEAHLTGSGETVLGPFKNPLGGPSYIELAQERGASYFDIGDAWNSATPIQRLAANQHVLDIAIANRDTIKLSTPIDSVIDNTYTAAELRYLMAHGYEVTDGYTLVPPKIGG